MLSKFHHFQHLAELYHGYHVIHRYVVRWAGALPARRGGLGTSHRAADLWVEQKPTHRV